MIDLTQFCAEEGQQMIHRLVEPFSDTEHSYAADTCIMIRVPLRDDIENNPPPGNKRLFDEAISESSDYIDMPEHEIPEPNCPECDGTKIVATCPECRDQQEIELHSDYNEYIVDCQTCAAGRITSFECQNCQGTGYQDRLVIIDIGNGIYVDGLKLNKLKTYLSEIKISIDRDPAKAIHFTFNGGDGLLMPCRKPAGRKPNPESKS